MAHNYGPEVKTARDQIAEFGAPIFIRRGGVDTPSFALLDIKVKGVTIDGNLVRATDRFCYMASNDSLGDIDPETDQIVIASKPHRIVPYGTERIGPGGVVVLWLIQARL